MPNPIKMPFGRSGPASRVVSINRGPYVMEMADGENAELTMYGEIVERQPVDWWTGEPIEGSYIVQSEFLEDLKALAGAKTLTIRMNSVGGDAGVSILIHNRLRELAAKGMALTCIVDGVAMSGGSLIMSACDTVVVNPASIVMIHKCWSSLWGGYNADELKELVAKNEAWDKAQVSIYKRKCGLSDMVISNMMAKTTYMTGAEAVEKGFADKLLENAEPLNIAASADGRSLFVRGRQFHLIPRMFAPDIIPTVTSEAAAPVEANTNQPAQTGGQNGGMVGMISPRPSASVSRRSTRWQACSTLRPSMRLSTGTTPAPPRRWSIRPRKKRLSRAGNSWPRWRLTRRLLVSRMWSRPTVRAVMSLAVPAVRTVPRQWWHRHRRTPRRSTSGRRRYGKHERAGKKGGRT